jgi:hypothetical protein
MAAPIDPKPRFDVREFTRTARGSHRSEVDVTGFETSPLSADVLRMLAYLRDLESATMQWLRNVLVTPTHKDARTTAFLVTWAFEKFWIADALQAVTEANGYVAAPDLEPGSGPVGPSARRRRTLVEASERVGPIRSALQAIVVGPAIIAVHTTTELVDQWVTRAAYERVAQVSGSSHLSSLIGLILDVKRRHEEFFLEESVRRLSESARAGRLTRQALRSTAWPIGAIDRSDADRTFFEQYVFGTRGTGGSGTAAAAIADQIAVLPRIGPRVAATVQRRLAP